MNRLRGGVDIATSLRKACSPEETAPKRKHVRACGVYTWDHSAGRQFWDAAHLVPLQDDVQTFKMLITVHKVIQEGHKSVLKEAQLHVNWLRGLAKPHGNMTHGYGRLIQEYVRLLLHKLEFHRTHPAFNGTFEYEEYVSLRSTDDPNEGFEVILDLMNLQDAIDDFQRLVFASLTGRYGNECRISSLTAMVAESYGIYRFVTSMLRAMHAGSDTDALEPLRTRYASQHKRIRNFYFDCSTLKYLTTLVNIPELPEEPPNLFVMEDDAPALPRRPIERNDTAASVATTATSAAPLTVQPTGDWWRTQQQEELQRQQQAEAFAMQQQQQAEELARQQAAQQAAEEEFRRQQEQMALQQQQAQQEFYAQQQQQQQQGHLADMEQQLFLLSNQRDEAQLLLGQYDQRVQGLESELEQLKQMTSLSHEQLETHQQQIAALEDDVTTWRQKYEALAKLYSQLRQEHLDLLARSKKFEAKAKSAQESIDKRERLERDLKAKNLELADLIRERDRARYELDKARSQHKDETDRLERDISLLNDRIADSDRSKGHDFSALIANHNKEIEHLESKLRGMDPSSVQGKDEEIEILNETIATMEDELKSLSLHAQQPPSEGLDSILDTILSTASDHVQDALFNFENPMQAGNKNATPNYVLSVVEKASANVDQFAEAFIGYIAEGAPEAQTEIIRTAMTLADSTSDSLTNIKGLSWSKTDQAMDEIVDNIHNAATAVCVFYDSLQSKVLSDSDIDEKIELIGTNQVEIQQYFQTLISSLEPLMPTSGLANKGGDIGDLVDNEMSRVAKAVEMANERLQGLLARPRDPKFTAFDRHLNEAIISAAVAITSAIAALIKAATDCQNEIVASGRGTDSKHQYYKKHHRWTQGLISAARAIAGSTNVLIETADGTLTGKNSPEELVVASKEVAASTAQLVAASRVRTSYNSRTQEKLELASKSVTSACNSLVSRVQEILNKHTKSPDEYDFSALSTHEFRTAAMNQQVEVLKIEQQLQAAQNRLFAIRKEEYVRQDEDDE